MAFLTFWPSCTYKNEGNITTATKLQNPESEPNIKVQSLLETENDLFSIVYGGWMGWDERGHLGWHATYTPPWCTKTPLSCPLFQMAFLAQIFMLVPAYTPANHSLATGGWWIWKRNMSLRKFRSQTEEIAVVASVMIVLVCKEAVKRPSTFGLNCDSNIHVTSLMGGLFVIALQFSKQIGRNFLVISGNLLADFCIRIGGSFNPSVQETFEPTSFQVCHCQQSAVAQGETTMFQCEGVVVGRYVTIHFPHNTTAALHVCEVEVFGTSESNCFVLLLNKVTYISWWHDSYLFLFLTHIKLSCLSHFCSAILESSNGFIPKR